MLIYRRYVQILDFFDAVISHRTLFRFLFLRHSSACLRQTWGRTEKVIYPQVFDLKSVAYSRYKWIYWQSSLKKS